MHAKNVLMVGKSENLIHSENLLWKIYLILDSAFQRNNFVQTFLVRLRCEIKCLSSFKCFWEKRKIVFANPLQLNGNFCASFKASLRAHPHWRQSDVLQIKGQVINAITHPAASNCLPRISAWKQTCCRACWNNASQF